MSFTVHTQKWIPLREVYQEGGMEQGVSGEFQIPTLWRLLLPLLPGMKVLLDLLHAFLPPTSHTMHELSTDKSQSKNTLNGICISTSNTSSTNFNDSCYHLGKVGVDHETCKHNAQCNRRMLQMPEPGEGRALLHREYRASCPSMWSCNHWLPMFGNGVQSLHETHWSKEEYDIAHYTTSRRRGNSIQG